MSTVYISEPPTKGKVVVKTTHGPLDIELWPKEAPKAVRNFVQLCLEGYYDNTIFHRIIKGFLIQGGDPTGSGTGGESIYGGTFSDEFHSRLRFKSRGLVACANAGSPHSNGSQFFISLDRCEWLDRKNTIFGKVTGHSVFNLDNIAELETGKDDRPLDPPPRIISVEVLWNPFEDIVPRESAKLLPQSATDKNDKDIKIKAVKKLNLLSFGEEAEEDEKELTAVKRKIKSSHDVLDDPRLLKEENPTRELSSSEAKRAKDAQLSVRVALSSRKDELLGATFDQDLDYSDDDGANFDTRMRQNVLRKRMELGDLPSEQKIPNGSSSLKNNAKSTASSKADGDIHDDLPKRDKLSLKKKGIGSEARAERMASADVDLQMLGEAERGRHLQKQKKRRLQGREEDVLAKLEKFKASISAKPTATNSESEGGNVEDTSDWGASLLTFAPESGKDRMSRSNNPDDYVVHDPLLEKGKEKFNRMQAKQKRREREWAGKSLT